MMIDVIGNDPRTWSRAPVAGAFRRAAYASNIRRDVPACTPSRVAPRDARRSYDPLMAAADDRLDIIELIHRYAVIVDLDRYDDIPLVFAPEARCDYTSMAAFLGDDVCPTGLADIERWMRRYNENRPSLHFMHNHVVDFLDATAPGCGTTRTTRTRRSPASTRPKPAAPSTGGGSRACGATNVSSTRRGCPRRRPEPRSEAGPLGRLQPARRNR